MSNQNNQKKSSYLHMVPALKRDGSTFISATMKGLVCRPSELIHQGDNLILNFRMPIYNKGNYIAAMCRMQPVEEQDGTVWADVSLWQKDDAEYGLATKMDRLIKANPGKRIAITLNGSIRVAEQTDRNGHVYVNTRIVGSAFSVDRFLEAHQQGKKQTPQQVSQAKQWNGTHQQADNQPQAASQPAQVQSTAQQQNVSQRASQPQQTQSYPDPDYEDDGIYIIDEDEESPF